MIPRSFRSVQTSGTCPTGLNAPGEQASELDVTSAPFLSQCVDYIWVTENIVIEKAGRCFDHPDPRDPTLWPSDHVGVWADLSFRQTAG